MRFIMLFVLTVCFNFGCSEASKKKLPRVPIEKISDTNTEVFRPQVDILFVIDDSGSMDDHQEKLVKNIAAFSNDIVSNKILDYHVGVITSSMKNAKGGGKLVGLPTYVERKTPAGLEVLSKKLLVGTVGDSDEAFFDPVYSALSSPLLETTNFGFYREKAVLAVIILTDTQDQSKNTDSIKLQNYLRSLKNFDEDKLIIGGVYIKSIEEAKSCPTLEEFEIKKNNRLQQFFMDTNAITFNLCDPNYGEKIAELGTAIATQASLARLGNKLPKESTISISIGGVLLPNDALTGWVYIESKNAILFGPSIEWDKYPDNEYPQINYVPRDIDFPK